MEHIYKNRFPFKQIGDEEWCDLSFFDPFLPYYAKNYETINKIKTKGNIQDIIDNILPFMKYLKSLENIRIITNNNLKNVKTKYDVGIITFGGNDDDIECIWYGYFTFEYKNFNIILVQDDRDELHTYPLPKKPFKIELTICYYYSQEKILKELEFYPPNVYKKDQCVICLDNTPNILFNPCLHVCVCNECEDKTIFKKCPYCRIMIKEFSIIKK